MSKEELRKIWRRTDLSFQSCHEKFDEFWTEHLKVSKIFILMGSFSAKDILFGLKKYRGVIFHESEEGHKIRRGIDLPLQSWHKEFDKCWPEQSKVSINFLFNELLLSKVYIVWAKKVERSYLSWHWATMQNLKKNWLFDWKMTWVIWKTFTRVLESVKIGTFDGILLPKVENVWPYNLQRNYVSWQWTMIQKLKSNWLVALKLTWRTSQSLTWALRSLKNLYFDCLLVAKVYVV